MAAPGDNFLQAVQTYNYSDLGFLKNLLCITSQANTKFKNFQNIVAQLGDTVTFDKPPRMTSNTGLVVTDFQAVEQRVQSLVCNETYNVNYAFSSEQFLFNNIDEYMRIFGKGAMIALANQVESSVARVAETSIYRWYGDGVTPINTFDQLVTANTLYRNFGSVGSELKVFLSDMMVPAIVSSGLNQFANNRNNELAKSWELGTYNNASYYVSNLLPIHTAGVASLSPVDDLSITAISGDGTQITLHSATQTSITNFILANDSGQITDLATLNKIKYLTFQGYQPSANPVQFRVVANADLNGSGNVTITVDPPLIYSADTSERNRNLTKAIATDNSMKVNFLPTCRFGMIIDGNALFVALPALGEQSPFVTSVATDPDTGLSVRLTHGSRLGANTIGNIHDCIIGKTLVPEYAMKIAIPV